MKISIELDAYEFATVVDILVNKNFEDYTYNDDDTDDTPDEKSDNTENLKAISDIAKIIADKITKSSNAE